MKLRLSAMALVMVLLLSGCSSLFQRPYSSKVTHVEYSVTEDPSILRAETYRGLVDAILYFVNEHTSKGVIRLYNYTSDVGSDLASACHEVTHEDPLGAFAVEDITYEFSRIVSYYEVTVSLSFSRSADEVDAIEFVSGSSAIRQKLRLVMAQAAPSLLLRVSYFTGDEDSVRAMAAQAYYDTPQTAFGMPDIQVSVYPDSGAQRIVSINFQWPDTQEELLRRSQTLLQAANDLLEASPPAEESYTPAELAGLLSQTALPMDPAGASDPYSALTGESANQLAHTLAMELLCQQAGIDATLVTGFADGNSTCWLIVDAGDGYRHLLPSAEGVQLCTDLEMAGLGYLWTSDLYPDCVDYNADLSGPLLSPPAEEDAEEQP